MARFAVKRLAQVEVDPDSSNQHELNAGELRRALGITATRLSGSLSIHLYTENESPPVLIETSYTLYDARENVPGRSEFRLYFSSPRIFEHARPGDLLLIYRPSHSDSELHAIVARAGGSAERDLQRALELEGSMAVPRFLQVSPPELDDEQAEEVASSLLGTGTVPEYEVQQNRLLAEIISSSEMPSTERIARAGREVAEHAFGSIADPDEFLLTALEAETALFFEIERVVRTPELETLLKEPSIELSRILEFARSVQQARFSRRGHSLQHHFRELLNKEGLDYSDRCVTEPQERPDFLMPSCNAYHDPNFPSSCLRMVACKTTARERWRQILNEARRIPEKYFLTVDEGLNEILVGTMSEAGLRLFLPSRLITRLYSDLQRTRLVFTVAQLLGELNEAQTSPSRPEEVI